VPHLALPPRSAGDLRPRANQLLKDFRQPVDAHRLAGADVDEPPRGLRRPARKHVRFDEVLDGDEIARLLAIPVDGDLLLPQELPDEPGNHARVRGILVLSRAEDVEVAQRHRFETI